MECLHWKTFSLFWVYFELHGVLCFWVCLYWTDMHFAAKKLSRNDGNWSTDVLSKMYETEKHIHPFRCEDFIKLLNPKNSNSVLSNKYKRITTGYLLRSVLKNRLFLQLEIDLPYFISLLLIAFISKILINTKYAT